ncbi:MAG: polysaccharide deacetylase family protein [Firmicutes bacterium]|nr:polysaccharide deacetylase family protein [Bacillota bacterium]
MLLNSMVSMASAAQVQAQSQTQSQAQNQTAAESPCPAQSPFQAQSKILYLTFDDGPSVRFTPQLLDLLDSLQIKATFFVVGKFVKKNPDILRRMADSGHGIGLHSYNHRSAYLMTPATARKDFCQSIAALHLAGVEPTCFRPPWGHTREFTLALAMEFNLFPVYWDVMAQDWKATQSATEIQRRLLARTHSGSVICLHDGRGRNNAPGRTIQALKQVLPLWLADGYRFELVTKGLRPLPGGNPTNSNEPACSASSTGNLCSGNALKPEGSFL